MATLKFNAQDLADFARASHDNNPLHMDHDFAARTLYGRRVVFGALAVLRCLEQVRGSAQVRSSRDESLQHLEVEFRQPLFIGQEYRLDIQYPEPDGETAVLEVLDGRLSMLRLTVCFAAGPTRPLMEYNQFAALPAKPVCRTAPRICQIEELHQPVTLEGAYRIRRTVTSGGKRRQIVQNTGASSCTDVLMLCSYLIGMELPGRHALFLKLTLDFADIKTARSPLLKYRLEKQNFAADFGLLDLDLQVFASAGPVARGQLQAFVRRDTAAAADTGLLKSLLTRQNKALTGKTALVIGGSRGLGAVIVQALALQGCDVLVNFRSSRQQAEALQQSLAQAAGKVALVPGDAADESWCDATRQWLQKQNKGLDMLICNACAAPLAMDFSGPALTRMQSYINNNLALVTTPLAVFLDLLNQRRGMLVGISSNIVENDSHEWPHYRSLKLAVENLLESTAAHHPEIAFTLVRPPALLTEMSNTPGRMLSAIAPEYVAAALVDALHEQGTPGKTRMIRDFNEKQHRQQQSLSAVEDTIAIAATFTAEPLQPALAFWGKQLQRSLTPLFAPYNQVFQALLDPASILAGDGKGINVILLRFDDWLRELDSPVSDNVAGFLETTLSDLLSALTTFSRRASRYTLLLLCPPAPVYRDDAQWRGLFQSLEKSLSDAIAGIGNTGLINSADYHDAYGLAADNVHDALRDELGHMPFTDDYFNLLATLIVRRLYGLSAKPYKVIVADCDNTLWRGVCGEVGAEGVSIDAHQQMLQQFLTQQQQQGMLICLASKNSEDDVWQVFEHRAADMSLKRQHIVDSRIDWQPKPDNLQSLAAALNLGLDSFIFIDDNPLECAEMRSRCPQVLTLQWPDDETAARRYLQHLWAFDHVRVSAEDRQRTRMYQAGIERDRLQAAAGDFAGFLQSLELIIEIAAPAAEDLPRMAQLTQRTNQFNFTTLRRSESELRALLEDQTCDCRSVRVRDRFGDYGLVGVLIAVRDNDTLALDTFLLSCRVLGRGVEHRMLAELGTLAEQRGLTKVRIAFKKTAKNQPARQFLRELGEPDSAGEDEEPVWLQTAENFAAFEFKPPQTAPMLPADKSSSSGTVAAESEADFASQNLLLNIATRLSDIRTLSAGICGTETSPIQPASAGTDYRQTLERLKELFATTLGLALEDIETDAALETYVADSFKIVELTVALKKRWPELPATFLFEHKSLHSIVDHLAHNTQPVHSAESIPPDRAAGSSDIAIIGINGRFPQAPDIDTFWDNLKIGLCSIADIPAGRWEVDAFFDADGKADKSYCRRGGFLDRVDRFDAAFFHISPREAQLMDPQQRLFLEIVWGLLEDAGYTRADMDRDTGVFVGCYASDYGLYANDLALQGVSAYRNADHYQIANRVSYFFDFHGPSLAIDTACSASGTSIYLACESLKQSQCRVAVAGGINLFLHPSRFIQYSQMQMLSPTGQCRPFSANADGTVFGEGVGALLLKPLTAAERDGDHIYGVIKSCAINAGGKTNGFTVPNPQAQAELVSKALRTADIDPRSIGYIETHGTGTPLGDPIEIRGLSMAFAQNARAQTGTRPADRQFCAIGSVKANIGHLETAAAMPGIIKILLQMKHRTLVPSLFAATPNPDIAFDASPFYVQQKVSDWRPVTLQQNGRQKTYPLRAAISSFGAGGSNAHIIIEEYPSAELSPGPSAATQLIVLSARTAQDLDHTIDSLSGFLQRPDHAGLRLQDIAYTLQVGREALEHRLAVIAGSIGELLEKLSEPAQTGAVYRACVKPRRERPEPLIPAPQTLEELARLWLQGADVDWRTWYENNSQLTPRRLSLPGYPFGGERHWLPGDPHLQLAQRHKSKPLHPLLDHADAGLSFSAGRDAVAGVVFKKILQRSDPVIADHVVQDRTILPGVAYLEMAYAALAQIKPGQRYRLADVLWSHPLEVAQEPVEARITLREDHQQLGFEIHSAAQAGVAHARGLLLPIADSAADRIDVAAIRNRCGDPIGHDEIYRQFTAIGIGYGPYFRGIERFEYNADEALSLIRLPQRFEAQLENYALQPTLVDGVLQTALQLTQMTQRPALPFSAAAVEILCPLSPLMFGYVRKSAGQRYQALLLDEQGRICVRFSDLVLRELKDNFERFFYTPRWCLEALQAPATLPAAGTIWVVYDERSSALKDRLIGRLNNSSVTIRPISLADPLSWQDYLQSSDYPDSIYFLGGISTEPFDPDDAEPSAIRALFRLIKALAGGDRTIRLYVVTNNVYSLSAHQPSQPYAAGLTGLARVAGREFPHLQVSCIDIDLADLNLADIDPIASILTEPAGNAEEIVIRHGLRYSRSLLPVQLPAVTAGTYPFKVNGVYLILGGAGGLGFEFSRYLAERFQARLMWLGRSAADNGLQEKIERIEALGGQVLYAQADATDMGAMQLAVERAVEHFGPIHGAIHSAIVLSDRTLVNMDEQQFNAAFAPKVQGSLAFYRALKSQPLDFMLFFSSANSFMASMGQSNYVAGCCFKDAFAHYLDGISSFPVRVINWGYWGSVGVVSGSDYKKRMTAQGHRSITAQDGIEAVNRVLVQPLAQVLAIRADDAPLAAMGVDLQQTMQVYPPRLADLLEATVSQAGIPHLASELVAGFQHSFRQLEQYARLALLSALQGMGVFRRNGEHYQLDKLRRRLQVAEDYYLLFDALLEILAGTGFIDIDGACIATTADLDDSELTARLQNLADIERDLSEHHPLVAERMPLLTACIQALPEMLSARQNPMPVLFPGGSLERVERIYRGNDITDFFNRRLAGLIESYVRQRLQHDPKAVVRILEVGAGTGGSTAQVLPLLQPFGGRIDYVYSDISLKFIQHGERVFGADYPFLQGRRLNMEQTPEQQGFARDSFDLIFGTNCVHATRAMTATLNRLKRLLKTHGLFIVNEFTERFDYNTLTFGWTSGWWLFEDAPLRIRHTPLLNRSQWQQLLEHNGFYGVRFAGVDDGGATGTVDVGQCLIVAASDGLVIDESRSDRQEISDQREIPEQQEIPDLSNLPDLFKIPPNPPLAKGGTGSEVNLQALTNVYVREVFFEVLQVKKSAIDDDATFDQYGVDSLISLEITQRFERDFGRLPATLLFENMTVADLVEYFIGQHAETLQKKFTPAEDLSASLAKKGQSEIPPNPPLQRGGLEEGQLQKRTSEEDIAIIGIAGRYPMAADLDELWQRLRDGTSCICEIPPERWPADAYYSADADADTEDKSHSRWGGFIDDVDKFDALFFNISPKEAANLDPQERLFLETAWKTIEDAGYTRRQLAQLQQQHDSGIGVFVGCMYQQYPFISDDTATGALLATSSYWSIANRVSFFLDLNGPSMALDSACSSSLSAIHLACESIKRGECIAALAGGVNLNLHPAKYRRLQQLGMLASGPVSKSLGDGDGLVPGEGVGAVLLKPLALALGDGDHVYGVIKASVVNHDGKTSGFTVPNPNAQAALIGKALHKAAIEPDSIGYIEVAANGSALGDPIEIAGLSKAFHASAGMHQACALGSVKSNLGHLEAVSGMAQLSKVLLQFKHRQLVPSLNAEPLNPRLQFDDTPFYVQQRLSPWTADNGRPRRAAVSSFGAGGANAHLVLEEFSRQIAPDSEAIDTPKIFLLSAKNTDRLQTYAQAFRHFLTALDEPADMTDPLLIALTEDLTEIARQLLRLPEDTIDAGQNLAGYGFDITDLAELANRIGERYGIDLSVNRLFEQPTLAQLAHALLSRHADVLRDHYAGIAEWQPDDNGEAVSLADIVYTLQTGREPMNERFACIVKNKADLLDKLRRFCRIGAAPADEIENVWLGRIDTRPGKATLLIDDDEGRAYLESLMNHGKWHKLAQLWVAGVDVDWALLYRDDTASHALPRRIPLPTYPFARERHWISDKPVSSGTAVVPWLQTENNADKSADNDDNCRERFAQDIINLMAQLLQLDHQLIDSREELRSYGFDSVSLARLVQTINDQFEFEPDLDLTVFFSYPVIAACIQNIYQQYRPQLEQYYQVPVQPASATITPLTVQTLPIRRALNDLRTDEDAIAIIGISGRLPQSENLDEFWQHLLAGDELISEIPAQRWNWREQGHASGRWGSFLKQIDRFDAGFFGIAPREAEMMDPRQRLFLETVWNTLENAGYSPDELAGSHTGLFVGVGNNDYDTLLRRARVTPDAHSSTGVMVNSILANRISYWFDWHGPSEIVDTACSSSTVAVHRAVQAIRSGECDYAIAGGVNVLLDPQGFVTLDRAGVLSSDGKIRLFSEGATGYVRGEGVGAVLLKSLSAARADGDHIHGVIKASALNHDGRSYSLTAPNPAAQTEVMLRAYRQAQIDPGTVSYIEAQGTGSVLGDPIEISALKNAFHELYREWGTANGEPVCGIGYLKPHIGHLECASGIAALIKVVLALQNERLPAVKHIDQKAAAVHLQHSPFYMLRENQPWPRPASAGSAALTRRAGLNSFGFGGVNVHLVLEDYPGE